MVIVNDAEHASKMLGIESSDASDNVGLALAVHELARYVLPRPPESHIRHTLDNQECARVIHAHHLDFRGYRARILMTCRHSDRIPQINHQVVPIADDVRRMCRD